MLVYSTRGLNWVQVPLGAGLGFKHKYKNDGHVAITIYGDGAQNQGQVFEVRSTTCGSSRSECRASHLCLLSTVQSPFVRSS